MTRVEVLRWEVLDAALDDLARLRISVFRDFPYLYKGDMAYERRYVRVYRDSPQAVVVAAIDGTRIVGAATGLPLEDHADDFAAPLASAGIAAAEVFYCAESVLLAEYRGQGLGHAFFDHREAQARALGRKHAMFCSALRPDDHPSRPATYRALTSFWKKRGYAPLEGVTTTFDWTDVGASRETTKILQVWIRAL